MGSVKAARQAALAAYIAAGAALSAAGYTLTSPQANLNAIASAQQRLSDAGWHDHLAGDHEASTWRSVGEGLALDKRPCPAPDLLAVAGRVMPSVVMVAVFEQAKGDGSSNRPWLALASRRTLRPPS